MQSYTKRNEPIFHYNPAVLPEPFACNPFHFDYYKRETDRDFASRYRSAEKGSSCPLSLSLSFSFSLPPSSISANQIENRRVLRFGNRKRKTGLGIRGVSIETTTLAKVPRWNAFPNLFPILTKNYYLPIGIITRDRV